MLNNKSIKERTKQMYENRLDSIILEYNKKRYDQLPYYLITISAKTNEALKEKAKDLIKWIENESHGVLLSDVAHTLLVGRSHFFMRSALIVNSLSELLEKLKMIINSEISSDYYSNNGITEIKKKDISIINNGNSIIPKLEIIKHEEEKYKKELTALGKLYVEGYDLKWDMLYKIGEYKKIPMPTYPFAKVRYWIDEKEQEDHLVFEEKQLHPLVSKNVSTFYEACFSKVFNGEEFYLKDHVVGGDNILPGVVYLEMARAACEIASNEDIVTGFKDIVWSSPIRFTKEDKQKEVKIELFPNDDIIEYKIYSTDEEGKKINHGSGKLLSDTGQNSNDITKDINLPQILETCSHEIDGEECYKQFDLRGLKLGNSFRTIKKIRTSEKEAISFMELPSHLEKDFENFRLHPSVLDGALETVIGLAGNQALDSRAILLPYGLSEVRIYKNIPSKCYSYVKEVEDELNIDKSLKRFDVWILNQDEEVVLTVKGFTLKSTLIVKNKVKEIENPENVDLWYFKRLWEEVPNEDKNIKPLANAVIFDMDDKNYRDGIEQQLIEDDSTILVKNGEQFKEIKSNVFEIDMKNEEHYKLLFETLYNYGFNIENVVHLLCTENNEKWTTEEKLDLGCFSVIYLFKQLMNRRKLNFIYSHQMLDGTAEPAFEAVNGIIKTAMAENKFINCKTILFDNKNGFNNMKYICNEIYNDKDDIEVLYNVDKRYVIKSKSLDLLSKTNDAIRFKDEGVYIITGGMGKLGLVFANYIAKKAKANLILVGRSELNEEGYKELLKLEETQSIVKYVQADISNEAETIKLLNDIRNEFNKIDGIIHAAGCIRDSYIINKTNKEINEVLAPKVLGTLNIDNNTKDDDLDFFAMFSSVAAINGNLGQSDYAFANCYMDSLALKREKLKKQGKRKGKTLSINWPLWQGGGMKVSKEMEDMFWNALGLKTLNTVDGLTAFEKGINSDEVNLAVISGNKDKIEVGLGIKANEKINIDKSPEAESKELRMKTQGILVDIVGQILKVNSKDIHMNREMNDYGFNSITLTDFTSKINSLFDIDLTPAIYFEHSTLNSFLNYLITEYKNEITKYYSSQFDSTIQQIEEIVPAKPEKTTRVNRFKPKKTVEDLQEDNKTEQPIAIVGMSCRMPGAKNAVEFWKNIVEQKDLISEVPIERWDWKTLKSDPNKGSKSDISKWGGFMDDIDKFDPMFFGISPREAEKMDPQQRIFMETVWETIEDAGYRISDLSGSRTGLFVGVATEDYSDLARQNSVDIEAYSTMGLSHCILANRISYNFNWHGPSEPIDTACSSSLVAIHRAVQSIKNGDCDMALAGGINVMASPTLHISFSKGGMLSEDGRCKTFDKRANGYVRGEGTGAIFLKPLDKAIADGDNIYALIKGSAVNHGGRANSMTAPNPNAQCDVLVNAYNKAGVSPDRVSYIEAHGTGTSLGDPVEINALKMAFEKLYEKWDKPMSKTPYCGISAVKTNIGHLEASAGIAGVLKMILAMKHKTIPGLVHFNELNPYIKIEDSPFYIVENTKKWDSTGGIDNNELTRIGGVSSFGFGGVNAHVVIEEYNESAKNIKEEPTNDPQIIVMSAKTKESLVESVQQFREYIVCNNEEKSARLFDIAYTLQLGREEMEERLAIIVDNKDDLIRKLDAIISGENNIAGVFEGKVEQYTFQKYNDQNDCEEDMKFMKGLLENKEFEKVADMWLNGRKIPWEKLYKIHKPIRVSLPVYSFAKERYWFKLVDSQQEYIEYNNTIVSLHSMVDENVSTLSEQKFRKTLKVDEFFLRDHIVAGRILLPGVAYLEMVRAAGELANNCPVYSIKDVVWIQPITMDKNEKDVFISIYPKKDTFVYEVHSMEGTNKTIYSQGTLDYEENNMEAQKYNIQEIKERCNLVRDKESCYTNLYKKVGFDYGPSFQVTQLLCGSENEIIAELELPDDMDYSLSDFVLHPSLMDGAIRAIAGRKEIKNPVLHIPFSMEQLDIFKPIGKKCYSYARLVPETKNSESGSMKFDISILDEEGFEIVKMTNFTARPYKTKEIMYYIPTLDECGINNESIEIDEILQNATFVIFSNNTEEYRSLSTSIKEKESKKTIECIPIFKREQYKEENGVYEVNPSKEEDMIKVFESFKERGIFPAYIVNMWLLSEQDSMYLDENMHHKISKNIDARLEVGVFTTINIAKSLIKMDYQLKTKYMAVYKNKESPHYEMINGIAKSIGAISNNLEISSLGLDEETSNQSNIIVQKLLSKDNRNGMEFIYSKEKLMARTIKKYEKPKELGWSKTLKQGGIYILTGGMGGLGKIFTRYLSEEYRASLVLVGRKEENLDILNFIEQLKKSGSDAIYVRADISDFNETQNVVKIAKEKFGEINGVLHMAGVADETLLPQSHKAIFDKVFAPKLHGTINLDIATKDEKMDFFVMFSSISVELGDMGACSYATANCFMDRYSKMRDDLKYKGVRYGKTISINWPLWKDGGIQLEEEQEKFYFEYSGIKPMDEITGIKILEDVLNFNIPQVIPVLGEQNKIERVLRVKHDFEKEKIQEENIKVNTNIVMEQQYDKALFKAMETYLKKLLSITTNIPENKIDSKMPLEKYGIDSMLIMELNKNLEKDFESLPRTLFFEYINLYEITGYFVENHLERVREICGISTNTNEVKNTVKEEPIAHRFVPEVKVEETNLRSKCIVDDDIAIVGISGRYPKANDLEQFWENLKEGLDCITEIPKARWDYEKNFDPEKGKVGKVYSKWGGFIDGIDKFDPLFFNISPREASYLDPQERLFIENVWQTIEDAGYSSKGISGSNTGVFVGVMYGHYQLYGAEESLKGNPMSLSSSFGSIANRISYMLNISGPSMAVDTMCSSSLTAIHLACESIKRGECDSAIAGGVNVTIHPDKYLFLSRQRFASSDGKCRAFGEGGDGYVPGEGVGSVLLKPLKKAIQDGDCIYAVIKGTAINHGGKTNGYSVPNPNAQTNVIERALNENNINPATINYIESHGTGTALGDPIEITGLVKAYKKYTDKTGYCAIGSVKSNIGHAESAAGIASITKVVMQMKNKKLVPSIHSNTLNPNIDFENSPFYVQRKYEDWNRVKINENGELIEYPRRAGVSSFGAGGTNVHILMEEYEEEIKENKFSEIETPKLLVLSAKNKERLNEYVTSLKAYAQKTLDKNINVSLSDIAYTLQIGRDAMEERVAIISSTIEELIEKIDIYLNGETMANGIYSNNIMKQEFVNSFDLEDSEDLEYLSNILKKANLDKIARLWVNGTDIDWDNMTREDKVKRISLPTYPFARERYWYPTKNVELASNENKINFESLHPLIDKNESTLYKQRFKKTLRLEEFFLKDHVIGGKVLLPGVAYLEMARAAGEIAGEEEVMMLKDVSWIKPIEMDKELKDLFINLYPQNKYIEYEIYSIVENEHTIHSQGKIIYISQLNEKDIVDVPRIFNIDEIASRCYGRKDKHQCYNDLYKSIGFHYGPSFQVTEEVLSGNGEVLAKLQIPKEISHDINKYVLHPSLLDGAVRAIAARDGGEDAGLHIPFALGSITIFAPISETVYSYATVVPETINNSGGAMRFNISVLDETGMELVRINDFSVRPFKNKPSDSIYLKPEWKEEYTSIDNAVEPNIKDLLVICKEDMVDELNEYFKGNIYNYANISFAIKSDLYKLDEQDGIKKYYLNYEDLQSYNKLLRDIQIVGRNSLDILHLCNLKPESKPTDISKTHNNFRSDLYSIKSIFTAVNDSMNNVGVKCIFVFRNNKKNTVPWLEAISGFSKSISIINNKFEMANVEFDDTMDLDTIGKLLIEELKTTENINGKELRYVNGRRYTRKITKYNPSILANSNKPLLKKGGVYLIAGGFGGLGMIFASHLAEIYNARLVFIGRQAMDSKQESKVAKLESLGGTVSYYRCDIGNRADVRDTVFKIKEDFGKLNGVIHSAGLMDTIPVIESDNDSFDKVLTSKIDGAVNLDLATAEENLDFFLMFSSISSEIGDLGACSYAVANSFMDRYSIYRNNLVAQNERYGKTISVNWPLWENGGMELPEEQSVFYFKYLGMKLMTSSEGIEIFNNALVSDVSQLISISGDEYKIKKAFKVDGFKKKEIDVKEIEPVVNIITETNINAKEQTRGQEDKLFIQTENYLKKIFSDIIDVPVSQISSKVELDKYGIDSVIIMEVNKVLDKEFEDIPTTLFFEYNNLHDLTNYFIKNYRDVLLSLFGIEINNSDNHVGYIEINKPEENQQEKIKPVQEFNYSNVLSRNRFVQETSKEVIAKTDDTKKSNKDIAIIGINGKYPMANNIEGFWENLKSGKDCITEIPIERWDYTEGYDPKKGKPGKYYSKWGGFIEGVDNFDPMFFQLTPRDAEYLDPQERLFLENAYHTFEDAGYTREALGKHKVGVYVGVMYGHYQLFAAEESLKGNVITLGSSYASIANRVSYYFNLKGPSLAIDTMCSSSLTAIHLACESIRQGETDMALAGGVNVTIHPDKFVFLSSHRFAASDGRCRAFGEGGDGYVPGEGVGAVLLKSLDKAIEDGDQIYAVIKGSAVNHGGKTNGYTVPSPAAQGDLILDVFKKSNINPSTVNYIEAHGTGTSLGDPIEISGLMRVFSEYTDKKQFCSIGSVKSNIGHLESAAGIAAITKVVLQMKHKLLVPSIHSDTLNPNINFENSPFYVQRDLEKWDSIVEDQVVYPRRAGVSSFGAGGTNTHIILEEYVDNKTNNIRTDNKEQQIIVLSAKNPEKLKELASNTLGFIEETSIANELNDEDIQYKVIETEKRLSAIIEKNVGLPQDGIEYCENLGEYGIDIIEFSRIAEAINLELETNITASMLMEHSTIKKIAEKLVKFPKTSKPKTTINTLRLEDIAYTLQIGREAMNERVAFVVESLDELKEKLFAFANQNKILENTFRGSKNEVAGNNILIEDAEGEAFIKVIVENEKYTKIAQMWASGIDIDWNILYSNNKNNTLMRKISLPNYPFARERYWVPGRTDNKLELTGVKKLHPLVDYNESDLEEICYRKTFTPQDIWIREYKTDKGYVLPQSVFIEMVMAVGQLANRRQKLAGIQNVKWHEVNNILNLPQDVVVNVFEYEDAAFFEVSSDRLSESERTIYVEGELYYLNNDSHNIKDVEIDEIKSRTDYQYNKNQFYQEYENKGIIHGETYKVVEELYGNKNEILVKLNSTQTGYLMNPEVVQAGIDSLEMLYKDDNLKQINNIELDFIQEIETYAPLNDIYYVYIWRDSQESNMIFINSEGKVLARINGISIGTNNGYIQDSEEENEDDILSLLIKLESKELNVEEVKARLGVW